MPLEDKKKECLLNKNSDNSPGALIKRLLSESAAPLAGLSAATIAYGAAAMLPVWLPAALGRKKRRRRDLFNKKEIETKSTLTKLILKSIQERNLGA